MKLRYTKKQNEGGDVWSFYFEPLEKISWVAGQSIRLELPRPTWGVSERRFTIASAPHERHVRITTRLSDSDFKQALVQLKEGDTINSYAVEGEFVWGKSPKHRLFIAAGIGITPFRAILADRSHRKLPLNATLLYSSAEQPILFREELDSWQQADPTFQIRYFVGERIALERESSLAPYWLNSLVYISGPTRMVEDLNEQFLHHGLPPKQLLRDAFTGYND